MTNPYCTSGVYHGRLVANVVRVSLASVVTRSSSGFHNFWSYEGHQQQDQLIDFMKNLAILGGLIQIAAVGPGPWSIDNR